MAWFVRGLKCWVRLCEGVKAEGDVIQGVRSNVGTPMSTVRTLSVPTLAPTPLLALF